MALDASDNFLDSLLVEFELNDLPSLDGENELLDDILNFHSQNKNRLYKGITVDDLREADLHFFDKEPCDIRNQDVASYLGMMSDYFMGECVHAENREDKLIHLRRYASIEQDIKDFPSEQEEDNFCWNCVDMFYISETDLQNIG